MLILRSHNYFSSRSIIIEQFSIERVIFVNKFTKVEIVYDENTYERDQQLDFKLNRHVHT